MQPTPTVILAIAAGGALGSVSRYFVGHAATVLMPGRFPWERWW